MLSAGKDKNGGPVWRVMSNKVRPVDHADADDAFTRGSAPPSSNAFTLGKSRATTAASNGVAPNLVAKSTWAPHLMR